jgi:hypothetical protein
MSTITFDTLKFVKKLESSGLPIPQAEAIAEAFKDASSEAELATKQDVKELEMTLRGHISEMKYDLIKWIVGLSLAQIAMLIGIFIKVH